MGVPGIHVAAVLLACLATGLLGMGVWRRASPWQRRFLLVAFLLQLPACAAAFHYVRQPLDGLIRTWLDPKGLAYPWVALLYAPLTEETAKLLPLLIPWLRRGLVTPDGQGEEADRRARVLMGMTLGLGFGVGEAFFLAGLIARNPEFAKLPFWAFGGYFTERLIVCFLHGAFTATALTGLGPGRRFLPRVGLAMLLHLGCNAPILIFAFFKAQLGKVLVGQILFAWLLLFTAAMATLLSHHYRPGAKVRSFILGRARCPLCSQVHLRPWFGMNAFDRRYERCPSCKRWRWIIDRHHAVQDSED